jgi:GNAT superfamily N-acetyltransferase
VTSTDLPGGYEIDDDPARIDRDAVWQFLSVEAYWGRWRSRAVVEQQIDRSWRVLGLYAAHAAGGDVAAATMVGFARAVSDGASLAYLADVYVLPEHRGRGLGVALLEAMIEGGPGRRFRWMLHTYDAHGLYAKLGFAPPDGTYLERPARPDDGAV